MKKQKIPLGVFKTLTYAMQILECEYYCHDSDHESIKKKEKKIQNEVKRAEKWLAKFEVSK